MEFWFYFWTANVLLAGAAFALIALVVAVRGIDDLRHMFEALRPGRPEEPRQ